MLFLSLLHIYTIALVGPHIEHGQMQVSQHLRLQTAQNTHFQIFFFTLTLYDVKYKTLNMVVSTAQHRSPTHLLIKAFGLPWAAHQKKINFIARGTKAACFTQRRN